MGYFYLVVVILVLLYVIEKTNYGKQINRKRVSKEQAQKELVKILSNVNTIPFLKLYFRRVTSDFIDKEGKEFFKDYMLKFIFDNDLQNSRGTRKRYPYEKIKKLLESFYPQDPMSDILILDNSGFQPNFYRRHQNQRHYNRRRVSNEYFSFVIRILLEKKDLIYKELGFNVDYYLMTMDRLLHEEIRLHSRSERDVESYFIDVKALYTEGFDNSEVEKVINFLCTSDSVYKLYRIEETLLCSDYIMLYDNMFSIIVDRLEDKKSSLGNTLGEMFEKELENVFSTKYKTYRNCTINNQEIDIVCIFGDVLFLVEAKARYYSISSMENEKKRNNARKKVEHAIKQLNSRMDDLFEGYDIKDSEGNFVASKNTTKMVMPMIVTLEDLFDLNNITGETAKKRGLEFLAFTISLDELHGVFNIMSTPYNLVNYIYNRNMDMIFNRHHFDLDKFSDFVIKNKKCKHIDRYGVHLQYKIRDLYSVNRILELWGKDKKMDFEDLFSSDIIRLLNEITESNNQDYNSYISLLLDYFYNHENLESILEKKLVLNKVDMTGKQNKEVWMISVKENQVCDYLILLDDKNYSFKNVIKK